MSAAAEFALLRDIQRTLRLYEIAGRVSEEAAFLRQRVLARMAKLAPLLMVLVALYALPAIARDDGRYAQSLNKDWVKGLKSRASGSVGCCDLSDGAPPEAVWDMGGGRYQVTIEGKSYEVPDDAVITEPNRLGYAVVWFYWTVGADGVRKPVIRCFIAGAGG